MEQEQIMIKLQDENMHDKGAQLCKLRVTVALVAEYQNLNSGKRLDKTYYYNVFCFRSRISPDERTELFILGSWKTGRSVWK